MAIHQLAKGLASLGRHGDSMLMHVSPSEVAGLQQLGNMTGHKLHTNPHTGMPEAFDFGNFITSLLPTVAGFLVGGPAGAGLGLEAGSTAATIAPIAAGMATGAAVAGAKGEDILTGSLMGGLGGYGGGGLGSAAGQANAAINSMNPTAAGFTSPQGITSLTNPIKDVPGTMLPDATADTLGQNLNNMTSTLTNPIGTAPGVGIDYSKVASSGVNLPAGALPNLGTQSPGFLDTYIDKLGGTNKALMKVGVPVGMSALQAMQPKPIDMMAEEEKRKAEENKYRDPITGKLNLAQASPGLRLATGGTVNTNQSTASTGGIQDLYGSNDNTTGSALSQDGYGIGRLNALTALGSRAKAADTFYAEGGPIAFAEGGIFQAQAAKGGYLDGAGDGMSDSIPGTIEGKQPARLADGEFVIPADVVSHIGNGSSKAGSKQLYSMLDRIRKARTGHAKQGKEINPNKYMPA